MENYLRLVFSMEVFLRSLRSCSFPLKMTSLFHTEDLPRNIFFMEVFYSRIILLTRKVSIFLWETRLSFFHWTTSRGLLFLWKTIFGTIGYCSPSLKMTFSLPQIRHLPLLRYSNPQERYIFSMTDYMRSVFH